MCSEENTHLHFLLYLHGKCLHLHKIFKECVAGNAYFTGKKVKYSLPPVTSCWGVFRTFFLWESLRISEILT